MEHVDIKKAMPEFNQQKPVVTKNRATRKR